MQKLSINWLASKPKKVVQMPDEKEYKVTLSFTEKSIPKTISTEIMAVSEADAINKAKIKLSLHKEGKNYQVIQGASAVPK